MARWSVSFEVKVPDDVTRAQVEEWLSYHVNGGSMDGALADYLGDVADRATSRPLLLRMSEAATGPAEGAR